MYSTLQWLKWLKFIFSPNHWNRFPFDWRNPTGYLIAILLQTTMVASVMNDFSASWLFMVAMFLYLRALSKDLKRSVKHINRNAKMKESRSRILEQLTESLEFFWRLKTYWLSCTISSIKLQWFVLFTRFFCSILIDFSDVYQILIAATFVSHIVIHTCIALMAIQLMLFQVTYNTKKITIWLRFNRYF